MALPMTQTPGASYDDPCLREPCESRSEIAIITALWHQTMATAFPANGNVVLHGCQNSSEQAGTDAATPNEASWELSVRP